jgi:hypothetical protein
VVSGRDSFTGQERTYFPIQHFKVDETPKIINIINSINSINMMMREMVGLNDASAGQSSDPKTLNGNLQVQLQGTESALYPLYSCVDRMTELVAQDLFYRLQSSVRRGWVNLNRMFSDITQAVILSTSGIDLAELTIMVEQRMTASEEQSLEAALQGQLMLRDQTGVGGIQIEDYIMVKEMPTWKSAVRMLALRRRERERKDSEKAQMNAKMNQEQTQLSIDGALQKQQMMFDQKLQLLAATNEAKSQMQAQKAQDEFMKVVNQIAEQSKANIQEMMAGLQADIKLLQEQTAMEKELIAVEGSQQRMTNAAAPKPVVSKS